MAVPPLTARSGRGLQSLAKVIQSPMRGESVGCASAWRWPTEGRSKRDARCLVVDLPISAESRLRACAIAERDSGEVGPARLLLGVACVRVKHSLPEAVVLAPGGFHDPLRIQHAITREVGHVT